MYKNRYRKAKKFHLGIRHEQYDGLDAYGDLMVDDQFVSKSKNVIKMDWDWCDYHLNNFYRLRSNPYRRLIKNSVGKNWDNVHNYIKRKIGRKGERFYRMNSMMEGNFPQRTFINDDGKIYFVEAKYRSGGFTEPYAGDIYIDPFGIVRKVPSGKPRFRYRWSPSTEDKFNIYATQTRRQFKVDDNLVYRELNNSYNQRLGGGRFNVVDEYNWFKLQFCEYKFMDKRWERNSITREYELKGFMTTISSLKRTSANKKDIKRLKLNEVK